MANNNVNSINSERNDKEEHISGRPGVDAIIFTLGQYLDRLVKKTRCKTLADLRKEGIQGGANMDLQYASKCWLLIDTRLLSEVGRRGVRRRTCDSSSPSNTPSNK